MNREETLALYEQGVEAWNKWANEMLVERKRLEEAGEWSVDENNEPLGSETSNWFQITSAIFSDIDLPHTFKNDADFTNFLFPSDVIFEGAHFLKFTFFNEAIFKGNVHLAKSEFLENVSFYKTNFSQSAFFQQVNFHDSAYFYTTFFSGLALFNNASFKSDAEFDKTTFNDEVQFHHTEFIKHTSFNGSIFKKGISLNKTSFLSEVDFIEAHFQDYSTFYNTTFHKNIYFENSIFKKDTWFENVNFNGEADFRQVSFKGITNFIKTKFKGIADFSSAKFYKNTSFYYNEFEQGINLNAILSENAFTLRGTKFKNQVPDFIQATFKEAPRLDNIKIEDDVSPGNFKKSIITFIHPDIKAHYQALKRLAVQAHDHENEQRFWAGELRSDRSLRTEDGGWNLRPLVSAFWWGNIAYGCVSDYGRSIVRPLISLFILLCLMTNIHLFAHNSNKDNQVSELRTKTHITKQSDLKDCDARASAFRVAAKNGAIGLLQNPAKRSIFVRDYTCLYGTYNDNATPKIPNSIFWIEIFHTLFSAILIFLALLGIRNNFKLK